MTLQVRTVSLADSDRWHRTSSSGLFIPCELRDELDPPPQMAPIGVDLFAGAGGMSCGFHQAGWHVAAAAEANIDAAATYLVNLGSPDTVIHVLDHPAPGATKRERRLHEQYGGQAVPAGEVFDGAGTGWIASQRDHEPGSCASHIDDPDRRLWFCEAYCAPPPHRLTCEHFYMGDVTDLRGADILADLGVDEVDGVFGGPPCQGFSKANGKSNTEKRTDPRNQLVFEFARLVLETRAKTMVMENVPAIVNMLTAEGVPVIDALARILEDGGFSTYDALKRSLLANSGASGAVRRRGAAADEPDDELDDAQLDLFASA